LVLVGHASVLNRLSCYDFLSRYQVLGCVLVGAQAPTGIRQLARIDIDLANQPHEDSLLCGSLPGATDRVVVISADIDVPTLEKVLSQLEQVPFEISLAPTIGVSERGTVLDVSNCLRLRRPAMSPSEWILKRALDLAVAAVLLLVLSPLLLIIAGLISWDSPGPILFRQTRRGWNKRVFAIYKFRTMWRDSSNIDGSVQALRADPRVTRVGALLRRSSLDELPQLLNVIEGTMSLVGPCPHPVELDRRFVDVVHGYSARHRVLPGITGLAQVSGHRGATPSNEAMQRRINYDLEYIRKRGLAMDVRILAHTVYAVIWGRNAY